MCGDRAKTLSINWECGYGQHRKIQAPNEGLELLDELGEAISGSDCTPPASHR